MKKPFLLVVFVDLVLLVLVFLAGRQVYSILGYSIAPVETVPTATVYVYRELEIEVSTPDSIMENSAFDIRIDLHNPDNEDVLVKLIVFPHSLVDSMQLLGTSLPVGEKIEIDDGVGFPVNILIKAGDSASFISSWEANKMQAIAGKVILFTDHARQEAGLALAVAPMPATETPTPEIVLETPSTELTISPVP